MLTATAGTFVGDTGVLSGSVDVSAFAGQALRIVFRWVVPEFRSGPAFFELDNITASGTVGTAAKRIFFREQLKNVVSHLR